MSLNAETYIHLPESHTTDAAYEVVPWLLELLRPVSVLDIGCGTGTWLKVFAEKGVNDYLGVDNPFIDRKRLLIDDSHFYGHDLTQPLDLHRKFDLVISLEVAEHLPEQAAQTFIASITTHGNAVLFSAAIPGQFGQHHLNEQWPAYWVALFEEQGYQVFDILRPFFWQNKAIEYWYKQNMLLFLPANRSLPGYQPSENVLPLVHPDLFHKLNEYAKELEAIRIQYMQRPGLRFALGSLYRSIFRTKATNPAGQTKK